MIEFQPISTKADLDLQDDDEILNGYLWGLRNADKPASDKSRGFWHGWRNAQVDKGRAEPDVPQMMLARELFGKYKGMN